MFHLMFVHYTFSSVGVSEWPPFGKFLPTRLAICSGFLLSICKNIYLPLLVLRVIASVDIHYFNHIPRNLLGLC